MRTSKKVWQQKMKNLIDRRKSGVTDNRQVESIISDYGRHLRSITFLGDKILDVGCGDCGITNTVEMKGKQYTGIDAFPINENIIETTIEECKFVDNAFDTVLCFAVLDGCFDLQLATKRMKEIAKTNVVFLTGVNIEPDQYHTFKITEEMLDELMLPMKPVMKNYLEPKVLLVEYKK